MCVLFGFACGLALVDCLLLCVFAFLYDWFCLVYWYLFAFVGLTLVCVVAVIPYFIWFNGVGFMLGLGLYACVPVSVVLLFRIVCGVVY